MAGERYNGYKNYETWAVVYWLVSERESYCYWCEAAENIKKMGTICWRVRNGPLNTLNDPRECLSKRLEDELSEGITEPPWGLHIDLIASALSRVDWGEVADEFL